MIVRNSILLLVGCAVGFLLGAMWQSNDVEEEVAKCVYLPIYGTDDSLQYYREVKCYLRVVKSAPIEERLRGVLSGLSKVRYKLLPIELVSLEESDGHLIASINLADPADPRHGSWNSRFEGSTGGWMTSVTLIETILQRDYDGEWIDGVRFTYNGKSMVQFDHVPDLSKLNMRDVDMRQAFR